MRSLKNFLLFGAIIGTALMSIIIYLGVSIGYEWYVGKQAIEKVEKTAQITFNSTYELMRKGWTGEELTSFLEANSDTYKQLNMQVDYYGAKPHNNTDSGLSDKVLKVFETGETQHFVDDKIVTYVYAQKIETECLVCHQDSKVGDVQGVIKVSENIAPIISDARHDTLLYLLSLFPIPIIGAFIISRYLANRIDKSIKELQGRIERVNKTDDLKLIEMNNIDLTFTEMNILYNELRSFAGRLRGIAVDKDILEFEVKLLEKFVITSEVVQDWKEHVKMLLLEINSIMEVHLIFSLFKIEGEDYALEVFWLYEPSEEVKVTFERIISNKLRDAKKYSEIVDVIGVKFSHNVAKTQKTIQILDEDSINFQTKTLFLATPQIGGIVGIGVNSSLTEDATRSLVIESILTTLLNVIGSVKAVYKYTKELEYFATRDPLTNLYTQRVFWELLTYEVLRAGRHNYKFAVLVIDLDDFKVINDIHGHLFGDQVLQEASLVIKGVLRKGDVLARYGGDEYTIILPYADQEQAYFVATRIIEQMQKYSKTAPNSSHVTIQASIGIAVYPDHADDSKNLFLIADNMMYKAKADGKGRVGLPDSDDVLEIFQIIKDKNTLLLKAVEQNKVIPYFQPIVNVANGNIIAHEILMRIELTDKIMVASDFVEIAESMGIISKLDYMLMDKALKYASIDKYEGYLFFNLSPKALIISDFVLKVQKMIKKYNINPNKVVFEITERETVKNLTVLEKFVVDLKREGFKFAIDDFGSGFSSFQYIKRLPIDIIKIEGDFIRSLTTEANIDKAIVLSIVTLARELGIKIVAEFVEDEEIYKAIKELGIDYGQGYYVGRPGANFIINS